MTRALVDAWEPIGEPRGEPRRRLPPLTAAMRRMVAERDAAALARRLGRDGTASEAGAAGSARMIVDRSMVGRIGRGRGPLPPPTVVDGLGRVTTPEEERRIEIAAALALRMARAEADVEAGVAGVRAARLGHPSLAEIKRAVARVWDVTVIDLVSRRRDKAVIEPRQAAMWIARRVTERSLPEIGRRLGGRDHTTVLHGVTQTDARMRANAGLTARIAEALARLGLDADDVGGGLGHGQVRDGTAARETVSAAARSRGVEGAP